MSCNPTIKYKCEESVALVISGIEAYKRCNASHLFISAAHPSQRISLAKRGLGHHCSARRVNVEVQTLMTFNKDLYAMPSLRYFSYVRVLVKE